MDHFVGLSQVMTILGTLNTVNDESLAWLKFGEFGKFAYVFSQTLFIQSLMWPSIC